MLRAGPLLLMIMTTPVSSPIPAEQPVRVTTDSSAYCQELASRVASQPNAAAEPARSLAEEGQKLCDTGHVRTGIARLRRALRATQPNGG